MDPFNIYMGYLWGGGGCSTYNWRLDQCQMSFGRRPRGGAADLRLGVVSPGPFRSRLVAGSDVSPWPPSAFPALVLAFNDGASLRHLRTSTAHHGCSPFFAFHHVVSPLRRRIDRRRAL